MPEGELIGQVFDHENVARLLVKRGDDITYKCRDCKIKGNSVRTFDQYSCDNHRGR